MNGSCKWEGRIWTLLLCEMVVFFSSWNDLKRRNYGQLILLFSFWGYALAKIPNMAFRRLLLAFYSSPGLVNSLLLGEIEWYPGFVFRFNAATRNLIFMFRKQKSSSEFGTGTRQYFAIASWHGAVPQQTYCGNWNSFVYFIHKDRCAWQATHEPVLKLKTYP